MMLAVIEACLKVLNSAEPEAKGWAAREAFDRLADLDCATIHSAPLPEPPARPARPTKPQLVHPTQVPRRRLGSEAGRAALLHAIAHIEFNAIDLAFDMAARFAPEVIQRGLDIQAFLKDWVSIGHEESLHFSMINGRMSDFDVSYGDFPSHDGLWEAAENTSDSLMARLAIAPMVLEARGLDVTPAMIDKLDQHGDQQSSAILTRIYQDEIGHVAAGARWFRQVCATENKDPVSTFQALVEDRFEGTLKEPFNHDARQDAGLELAFYQAWTAQTNCPVSPGSRVKGFVND